VVSAEEPHVQAVTHGESGRRRSTARAYGSLVAALLLALFVGAVSPGTALAATGRYLDPIFSSVRRDVDLTYGRAIHTDGSVEKLKLDLYRPVGDTARNRPAVIYVHGGTQDTTTKDPARNRLVGQLFAKRGFVAAVIDYRSGAGVDREAAWDTRAAVRWFRKNASWLRVAPSRIIVMGVSGGAITAMTVTFDWSDAGTSGSPGYSSKVAAGISLSGTASELYNIGSDEPPIAMIVAQDDAAFYAGTLATCEETKAFGNVCELFIYPEGGHPPPFWLENSKKITEQSSRFICKHVLGPVVCRDRNGDGIVDG
jgi:dienelactone hydrolase